MDDSKYDKFEALNPFFSIVMKGLDGLVDGTISGTPLLTRRSLSFCIISQDGPNVSRVALHT